MTMSTKRRLPTFEVAFDDQEAIMLGKRLLKPDGVLIVTINSMKLRIWVYCFVKYSLKAESRW